MCSTQTATRKVSMECLKSETGSCAAKMSTYVITQR